MFAKELVTMYNIADKKSELNWAARGVSVLIFDKSRKTRSKFDPEAK